MKGKFLFFGIFFILISITIISVGYASYNTQLMISGEAVVDPAQIIEITNISVDSSVSGGFETYVANFSKDDSKIYATLPNQSSKITFNITVTNNSSDIYRIESIEELFSDNPNIKYEIIDQDILYFNPNSSTDIQITLYYDSSITSNTSIGLGLKYNFVIVNYDPIEYVVFSGTQYIQTNLSNTGDYIFESEVYQTEYTNNDGGWIFSARTTAAYTLGVFIGKTGVYNGYGGTTSPKYPYKAINNWYEMYFSRSGLVLGGNNYSINGGNLIPPAYETFLRIGGATTAYSGVGMDTRHFIGYMKYFKITDATNGNVLFNFVPAKVNGVIGFMNLVDNSFYDADGTGSFLEP